MGAGGTHYASKNSLISRFGAQEAADLNITFFNKSVRMFYQIMMIQENLRAKMSFENLSHSPIKAMVRSLKIKYKPWLNLEM